MLKGYFVSLCVTCIGLHIIINIIFLYYFMLSYYSDEEEICTTERSKPAVPRWYAQ